MKDRKAQQPTNERGTTKKAYVAPSLKRYTSPKVRKHKSYKDITMLVVTPSASAAGGPSP
jgi:hypothetical protein